MECPTHLGTFWKHSQIRLLDDGAFWSPPFPVAIARLNQGEKKGSLDATAPSQNVLSLANCKHVGRTVEDLVNGEKPDAGKSAETALRPSDAERCH